MRPLNVVLKNINA